MEEKIVKLSKKCEADKDFVVQLFDFETQEEVQVFLKDNGFDFTLEEINDLKDMIDKVDEMGELSDDDLEEVAGGGAVTATATIVGALHTVTDGKSTDVVRRGARRVWRRVRRW